MLKILLVRHAECYMNLELANRIGGRSNSSPLTPLGHEQSLRLGQHLSRSLQLNGHAAETLRFFSSTAVRARDTALAVMEQLKVPASSLVETERLLELDMGEWEGGVRSELYCPANLEIIKQDVWNFAPPGGESQKQVEERMLAYLQEVVLPEAAPGRPALVFTHGLAIKCVLRGILGSKPAMTRRILLDNTAITEVGYMPEGPEQGWHVLRVNDASHLAGLSGPYSPALPAVPAAAAESGGTEEAPVGERAS